jgi:hypothetical protein
MRKLILIAGFVLASATAQAGEPRSLSLASDVPTAAAPAPAAAPVAETPKTAEAPQVTEAPKYVERPALRNQERLGQNGATRGRAAECRAGEAPREDGVKSGKAPAQALLDRRAYYRRTASARDLLVSDAANRLLFVMPRLVRFVPGIHALGVRGRRGWPGVGERKRRRPSDG